MFKCLKMGEFILVSGSLFNAVVLFFNLLSFLGDSCPTSQEDLQLLRSTARIYLRNYVTVVLLAESMSDGGED